MEKTIIFIDNPKEVDEINFKKINLQTTKIFTIDIITHQYLSEKNIPHEIGEKFLSTDDCHLIFDTVVKLWKWYDNKPEFEDMKLHGVNLLGLFDTTEFHNLIIKEIYHCLAIKRIIESEIPSKIIINKHFSNILKSIIKNQEIEIELFKINEHEFIITWNKFLKTIKFGHLSFTLTISRNTVNKIKKFVELLQNKFLNSSLTKIDTANSILFLEFDPSHYENLLNHLSRYGKNIIFLNRRKPITNPASIKILKRNNIKILLPNNILDSNDKITISSSIQKYSKILNSSWQKNQDNFSKVFGIEGTSIWPLIQETLYKIFQNRLNEFIELTIFAKKIHAVANLEHIISHNTLGETEKAILNVEHNENNSLMLQHAFANYPDSLQRYAIFDTSSFKDKIALWGKIQKTNLLQNNLIDEKNIVVFGSPHHDKFFNYDGNLVPSNKKTVVLATQNFELVNAQLTTETFVKLEKLLEKIFSFFSKIPNYELIIKLHPARDPWNEFVKSLIKKLNPGITILQDSSSFEVIKSAFALISLHTELIPSTVLLEGMIMKKPILNITFLEKTNFDYDKEEAVYTVYHKNISLNDIEKILYDLELRNSLITNGSRYVEKFLVNRGNASENLAEYLGKS